MDSWGGEVAEEGAAAAILQLHPHTQGWAFVRWAGACWMARSFGCGCCGGCRWSCLDVPEGIPTRLHLFSQRRCQHWSPADSFRRNHRWFRRNRLRSGHRFEAWRPSSSTPSHECGLDVGPKRLPVELSGGFSWISQHTYYQGRVRWNFQGHWRNRMHIWQTHLFVQGRGPPPEHWRFRWCCLYCWGYRFVCMFLQ